MTTLNIPCFRKPQAYAPDPSFSGRDVAAVQGGKYVINRDRVEAAYKNAE